MPFLVHLDPPNYEAIKQPFIYHKYLHMVLIMAFVGVIFFSKTRVPLNTPGIFGILELLAFYGLTIGEIAIMVYFVTSCIFLPLYEWMCFIILLLLCLIGKVLQSNDKEKMASAFSKNVTLSNYANGSLYSKEIQGYNSSYEFQNQTDAATKSQITSNDDLVNLPFINVVMHLLFGLLFTYLYRDAPSLIPEDTEQGAQVLYTSNLSGGTVAISPDINFSQDNRVQEAVQPIQIQTSQELENQDAQIGDPLLQPAQIDISSIEQATVSYRSRQSRNDPAQVSSPDDQMARLESNL